MKHTIFVLISWLMMLALIVSGCVSTPLPQPATPLPTYTIQPIEPLPTAEIVVTPKGLSANSYQLVSQDSLFNYLTALTSIQSYSGWRNSATEGEAEALDYVADQLKQFEYLNEAGLTIERQDFRVFLATELWETRLDVEIAGQEVEIPADGLRGHRDMISRALQFDSDGKLNDSNRDPIIVDGPIVVVRSVDDIHRLVPGDVQGKIVFIDYAAIDISQVEERAYDRTAALLVKKPAGIVVITHFSNAQRESHGAFIGDGQPFGSLDVDRLPPILYIRLEDMAIAGIKTWDDLAQIKSARMTWDADAFSPGTSGNLIAHIPGTDSSHAVILGGHIDSPNSPGAMDDGSGSVVLLEVARVVNATRLQPPMDIYLAWFGSEELNMYGSAHFAATHQDLLDRTTAMLQVDMLGRPVDGINPYLNLVAWSYGRHGDDRLAWPEYLTQKSDQLGITTRPIDRYAIESDNSAFAGFDVPNANLIYIDEPAMMRLGSIHYASHIHDPYDTVELARESGEVLEQMAQVALAAALETGHDDPDLRVAPRPDRRALFVASHTEPVLVGPIGFIDMAMTLAWAGFDVDMIPYGQPLTRSDLANADLVVAFGFKLDDAQLKRAGMDYWQQVRWQRWPNWGGFAQQLGPGARLWFIESHGQKRYTEVKFEPEDYLVFGRETAGLPKRLLEDHRERWLRIPMFNELARSLNLSNCVSVVLFEALRQQGFVGET